MKPTKKTIITICLTIGGIILLVIGNFIFSEWARKQYSYNEMCLEVQAHYPYYKEHTDFKVDFLFVRESVATKENGEKYDKDYYYRVTWIDGSIVREEIYVVRWVGYFKDTEVQKVPTEEPYEEDGGEENPSEEEPPEEGEKNEPPVEGGEE